MKDKYIIWSNDFSAIEELKNDILNETPDYSENEAYTIAEETNNEYIDDERANLNIRLTTSIIIIADIGRWNGRFSGYSMVESGNIRDCLYSNCDTIEWYVDKLGDLRCTEHHHDGTNYYLYRAVKETVSDDSLYYFQSLIYNNKATRNHINRYTYRLGDEIGKVYGWDFPKNKKTKQKMEFTK